MKRSNKINVPNGRPKASPAPRSWRKACASTECTLHQLAPYIGKIKSSIAGELVERYSHPGDLLVDPFAGAGTIPLEAAIRGRRVFGADISPYAVLLSRAKLFPPHSVEAAIKQAEQALSEAALLPRPDLRMVPSWVKRFFHPETLREAIKFASVCRTQGYDFLMACFLGILHHQRPGFLSFPSSHLVPYLRERKYPREKFPDLYLYRELKPRLIAKVRRSFKRFMIPPSLNVVGVENNPVQNLELPSSIGALITSPPYMNALDYGRDNRLRLWFIDPNLAKLVDTDITKRRKAFIDSITSLAVKLDQSLKPSGFCVFVVGEEFHRTFKAHPSDEVIDIMLEQAPSLRLKTILTDKIPDVRRTRRECKGVKIEHFLVFQKE